MSNSTPMKVHFKIGSESNADDLTKLPLQEGQIAFSIEEPATGPIKAYVYIDKKDSNNTIQRLKISSEYANRAISDESGNNIQASYIKNGSIKLKTGNNHTLTYTNQNNASSEVSLPYVLLAGDQMTGNLSTLGTMTATNGFIGNLTGNVTGNITGTSGEFGSVTIKGATTASNTYGSTNPRINFSSNAASPEIISLIYTDYNSINENAEEAAPHSLTLRGNGSVEPLFIVPRIKVGTNIDTAYAFNADSALIHNWIETTGTNGWKSNTYGGGIHMPNTSTVAIYGTKNFKVPGAVETVLEGTLKAGLIDNNSHYAMIVSNSGITLGDASAAQNNNCNLTTINGHIVVNPSKNSNVSYNEGIRINKKGSSSYWSGITLGGTDNSTSGTGNGVWFIGSKNNSNNFYLTHNNRDSFTLGIVGQLNNTEEKGFVIKPRVGINVDNVNNTYTLEVDGATYIHGITYFGGGIKLQTPTETSYPYNVGIFYKDLSSAAAAAPSSFGYGQVQFYGDKDTAQSASSRTGRDRRASVILSVSGAQNYVTHQLSFDVSTIEKEGNVTTCDGNLYHRIGSSTWENWKALLDNSNVKWSSWTAGTTAGPKANLELCGVVIQSVEIPSAAAGASGIVTTGTQTFSGDKNFNGNVTVNSSVIGLNNNITLGTGSNDSTNRSIIIQGKVGNITLTSPTSGNRVLSFNNINNATVNAIEASTTGITFNGALSGNATTATTLKTARTINGTSFNGSADITTDKWGKQRNITISDNDGSNTQATNNIDGSANFTLKLPATIKATLKGNADTATKATQDGNGKVIAEHYATKTDMNNLLATNDAMVFKGFIGNGTGNKVYNSLPSEHNAGDTYRVKTAGTYANVKCEVGDLIICVADGTIASDNDWTVAQTNLDGAVIGPATNPTSNALASFTTGSGTFIGAAPSKGSANKAIYVDSNGVMQQCNPMITGLSWNTANNRLDYSLDDGNANDNYVTIGYATKAGSADSATTASKLSTSAAVGSTNQAVYLKSDGTLATCNTMITGLQWVGTENNTAINALRYTKGGSNTNIIIEYATNAGTATNLASKPSFNASGNNITLTAGGQTSSAFTVPYATSAGNATTANSATTATSATSATTATKANKANLDTITNAVAYYSDTAGTFACNGALRLGNNGAQIYSMVSDNEPSLEFYRYNIGSYAARIYVDSSGMHIVA